MQKATAHPCLFLFALDVILRAATTHFHSTSQKNVRFSFLLFFLLRVPTVDTYGSVWLLVSRFFRQRADARAKEANHVLALLREAHREVLTQAVATTPSHSHSINKRNSSSDDASSSDAADDGERAHKKQRNSDDTPIASDDDVVEGVENAPPPCRTRLLGKPIWGGSQSEINVHHAEVAALLMRSSSDSDDVDPPQSTAATNVDEKVCDI
jgi:hypothetical protein